MHLRRRSDHEHQRPHGLVAGATARSDEPLFVGAQLRRDINPGCRARFGVHGMEGSGAARGRQLQPTPCEGVETGSVDDDDAGRAHADGLLGTPHALRNRIMRTRPHTFGGITHKYEVVDQIVQGGCIPCLPCIHRLPCTIARRRNLALQRACKPFGRRMDLVADPDDTRLEKLAACGVRRSRCSHAAQDVQDAAEWSEPRAVHRNARSRIGAPIHAQGDATQFMHRTAGKRERPAWRARVPGHFECIEHDIWTRRRPHVPRMNSTHMNSTRMNSTRMNGPRMRDLRMRDRSVFRVKLFVEACAVFHREIFHPKISHIEISHIESSHIESYCLEIRTQSCDKAVPLATGGCIEDNAVCRAGERGCRRIRRRAKIRRCQMRTHRAIRIEHARLSSLAALPDLDASDTRDTAGTTRRMPRGANVGDHASLDIRLDISLEVRLHIELHE